MSNWTDVKRIAGEALDLAPPERAAFLAAACAGDAELRTEVVSLLQASDAATGWFETPALALPAGAAALDRALQQRAVAPDTRVGPYRIVREIGHGGMGTVYLAERADGEFDQQVAIKFVGGRLGSRALVDRFRQERRILAVLDHPNIARLLDGGTTDDGWPFVVMEYVDGLPIDEYCESAGLDARARVRLFRHACAAVHYAHQRLVVHRDIKAGNILVTSDGTPKLLDFGIATLVEPGLSGEARAQTQLRALTPDAASPEQLRGESITIAADVYGLGVLLYRLLTGRSPYGDAVQSDAALLHAILEVEPGPPGVDHDLDVIVLKALRKEPARRYASAAALSDDLERFLTGRPVLAAPDSRAYRTRKFLRRHWAASGAAVIALTAMVAGAGLAWYQGTQAAAARDRAQRRFDDVRRLSNAFLFEFHDAIADLPGSLPARQLVVKRAAEYLDSLAAEAQGDASLQRELAVANQRLATILGGGGVSSLGDQQGAKTRYERALALRDSLIRHPAATVKDFEDFAFLRVELSRFHGATGDGRRADENAAAAIALLEEAEVRAPDAKRTALFATAYHQRAYSQMMLGNRDGAIAAFERSIGLARRQLETAAAQPVDIVRYARIAPDYSIQLLAAGRTAEARDLVHDARVKLETVVARDPVNKRYRQNLAYLYSQEAEAMARLGDVAGARGAYTHAIEIAEALRTEEPNDQGTQISAMLSLCAFGRMLAGAGDAAGGAERLRACVAIGDRMAATAPTNYVQGEVANARLHLGAALLSVPGGASQASGCRELRQGIEQSRRIGAIAPALAIGEAALAPFVARLSAACAGR